MTLSSIRPRDSSTRLHCMQLCAITDRKRAIRPLLSVVESWSAGGVHFIQLREKDLDHEALRSLVCELMGTIDRGRSKLLVNVSTPESAALALAAGADGVHLAGKPTAGAASSIRSGCCEVIISVPCHSLEDIDVAVEERVDLVLFSPVFEKVSGEKVSEQASPAQGLDELRRACAAARGVPVFALGGVTAANASDCIAAGAAGIAGIRLFAGDDWRRLCQPTEPGEPYIVG
jgi:thiamine-phosphate pyrophosphorylase